VEIIINEDVKICTNESFSENIPYRTIPKIIYKDYRFTQLLNVNFFTDYFNHKKVDYLRVYYCTCDNFQLCKFKKVCLENDSIKKVCPYSNKIDLDIQRKNSKNRNNAEEFVRIMKLFTNDNLYEYATWIIQNLNTVVTKELFEEMKMIPELDPKYFSECYNKYGRKRTLVETEQLIYKQDPFQLYKLNNDMPKFIHSYLQMANDYLTELNNLISGVTFDVISERLAKLKAQYKNERIFIPIFDYIIINIPNDGYKFYKDINSSNLCNFLHKDDDIFIKNSIISIRKKYFDDVILFFRSLHDDIYSLLIERYELKEHEKPITEDEINKFI
jgi:hypothetical protein